MTTALGLLYVPMIVQMFAPMPAGLAGAATVANSDSSMLGDPIPIGTWAGLGVVFAYAAVALLVTFWVVKRRDV